MGRISKGSTGLSQKLKDLQTQRDAGLITSEEYRSDARTSAFSPRKSRAGRGMQAAALYLICLERGEGRQESVEGASVIQRADPHPCRPFRKRAAAIVEDGQFGQGQPPQHNPAAHVKADLGDGLQSGRRWPTTKTSNL